MLEERAADDGTIIRNLDRIWDRALLQELIAFNMDGNFDRVMGLMGCIIGIEETYNKYNIEINKQKSSPVEQFLANNKYIFTN